MKTATKSEREEGDRDGAAGDQQRAPDQRPGVEGVDVFGPGLAGEEDRVELIVDVAAGAEPGEAVVGERRPRLDEDDDDHRQQQRHDGADQRAEHPLDAPVRPPWAVLLGEVLPPLTSWLLVEGGDAAGFGDHFPGDRVAARPVDELLHRRVRVRGRQDDEDVARERVLERLDADLRRHAGNAVDLQRLLALALPGEPVVADRVRVLLDRVDDEAVGGQRVDVGRRRFVVEDRLQEEVVRPSVGVAADRVDRRVEPGAGHPTPVGDQPPVDVVGLLDADVAQLVLRVDVDAEPVEVELDVGRAGIAGERRAGLPGELAGSVLDVFDAGVAAVGGVDELDLPFGHLRVLGEQRLQHGLRRDRAGPDQGLGAGRRRHGEPQEGDRRYGEGLASHLDCASFPAGYLELVE